MSDGYFMHIVGEDINEIQVYNHAYYTAGYVTIIQNFFNFYLIYFKIYTVGQHTLTYTYKPDGYNGEPYFSDLSTIADNMQLLNESGGVIFDRNLYDKQLTNNMISCIGQVPYNYLNNTPISIENFKDLFMIFVFC